MKFNRIAHNFFGGLKSVHTLQVGILSGKYRSRIRLTYPISDVTDFAKFAKFAKKHPEQTNFEIATASL